MFIQPVPGSPERLPYERIKAEMYLAFQGRACRCPPSICAAAAQSTKRGTHSV